MDGEVGSAVDEYLGGGKVSVGDRVEISGFVDDDSRKWGREIHGVRVVGGSERIPELVADLQVEVVVLAVPSAGGDKLRRLVGLIESTGVPFRTVPRLEALMSGQVSIQQLREVSIEDLLGREPVSLDWTGIRAGLKDKAILVTGAGGSIGSELCRQIAQVEPRALILLESSEFNLYSIELELRRRFPALTLLTHLCDVRDGPGLPDRQATSRLLTPRSACARRAAGTGSRRPGRRTPS